MDPPRPLTPRDLLIITSLNALFFTNSACYSVIGPFFPVFARSRGMGYISIGAVFVVFSVCSLLSSIYFGDRAVRFGPWRIFLIAICVESITGFLFGLSDSLWQFLLLRSAQGLAVGCSSTSIFILFCKLYPERLGLLNGVLEAVAGAGYVVGPPLGGILYSVGGFSLPFMVTNGIALAFVLPLFLVVSRKRDLWSGNEEVADKDKPKVSLFILLRVPEVLVTCVSVVVMMQVFTSVDAILSLHLIAQLGMSTMEVSYTFLVLAGSYSVLAMGVGHASDKLGAHKLFIWIGTLVAGLATCVLSLFVGRVPSSAWGVIKWLNEPQIHKGLAMGTIGVAAAGCSLLAIPALPDLIKSATHYCAEQWPSQTVHAEAHLSSRPLLSSPVLTTDNPVGGEVEPLDLEKGEEEIDVAGPMSGAYNVALSVGAIVGPLVSTSISDLAGTNMAFLVGGLMLLSFAVFLGVFILVRRSR